ncbi:hypothetical protein [Raoultella terrigena]|uniref:hypothetical protein n=1 Tax=Raoultella terrigena TaxID=577 RepID=UPI0005F80F2C|nr:hypothetical protein [Raoultella terrigena]
MNTFNELDRVTAATEIALIRWLTYGCVMDWLAYQACYCRLGRMAVDLTRLTVVSQIALKEMDRLAIDGPVAAALR